MKRLALLLALIVLPVAAAEGWEAVCAKEGGCKMITNQAYDAFVKELARLHAIIDKMKKEQCA
jgi:hypothetical protein